MNDLSYASGKEYFKVSVKQDNLNQLDRQISEKTLDLEKLKAEIRSRQAFLDSLNSIVKL